ncbi:MAG: hypothetical protein KJ626_03590, partial [Verrucomicrobia bacterium]|nr:hypothetical protein [Verrucomicrobiota bacterium]
RVHFDEVTKTQLFRILQESLTNVLRHSGATEVLVSLRCGEDLGFMEVQDNGKGLSEERAGSGKSFGLVGMEERALLLGGKLVVQSSLSRGTLVQVVFPISNKGREEEVDGD